MYDSRVAIVHNATALYKYTLIYEKYVPNKLYIYVYSIYVWVDMFAAFADGVLPAGYVCSVYCTYDVYVGINIIIHPKL